MSVKKLKNRQVLYAVLRKDIDKGQDVVCCFCRTAEGAENLADEYNQLFVDSGGNEEDAYYYPVSNIYYDR